MLLLAHSDDWLVDLVFLLPVLGFLCWLAVTTLRARQERLERRYPGAEPPRDPADGRPAGDERPTSP